MNTKLFVGNLDYSVSEVELRDTFLKCGEIDSVAVIMDRDTGRPRGFAFVEYTNAADAQRAVETLNGVELNGRAMNVSIARERERSGGGGGFGGGRERSGGGGGGFGGGRSGGGGYEGGRDCRGGGDRNDRRSGGRW